MFILLITCCIHHRNGSALWQSKVIGLVGGTFILKMAFSRSKVVGGCALCMSQCKGYYGIKLNGSRSAVFHFFFGLKALTAPLMEIRMNRK